MSSLQVPHYLYLITYSTCFTLFVLDSFYQFYNISIYRVSQKKVPDRNHSGQPGPLSNNFILERVHYDLSHGNTFLKFLKVNIPFLLISDLKTIIFLLDDAKLFKV